MEQTGKIQAEHLRIRYAERIIIEDLSLEVPTGVISALVGPNGSGKSTLLKTLARLLKAEHGLVYLDGKDISCVPSMEIARSMAILPQSPATPAGITVGELVEQGRYPHAGPLKMLRRQDHSMIEEALTLTNLQSMRHRYLDTLSGGERQRAWIALALAQDTPLLLLDEPTTFLDMKHQLEVLSLVRCLNRERAITIVLVLHDLNQAARYADHIFVLKQGQIVAQGAPSLILDSKLLADVFEIQAHILHDPQTGIPVCLPYDHIEVEAAV